MPGTVNNGNCFKNKRIDKLKWSREWEKERT